MEDVIKILLSYLLGSISGSLIVGKLKGVDIRKTGSGNAGGTNAFRTQGLIFALAVVVIDIGKGYIATAYFSHLNFAWAGGGAGLNTNLLTVLCGVAVIVGHVFPVFFGFRGGKGAGTTVGMIAAIELPLVPPMIFIWGIVLILTGLVGLATMCAGISIPILILLLKTNNPYLLPYSLLISLFIIFTHRENIRRMLGGNENRFEKAMLFRRKY
ncbi:MAG: glycerol-3-phosphate 1-O-acyltransferase PlsY [FCB group bacterium]|nr:glycerol-3-phosphate 1-O-acyltransferase PlsY [FCB group bacterium]